MDGVCTECEGNLKLFASPGSNFTKCVKRCPVFHKPEKGSSPARCEVKQEKNPVKTSKYKFREIQRGINEGTRNLGMAISC